MNFNVNINKTKDKIYIALQKKKINELKIAARDLKIKGYSTMQKEDLVKKIYEIVKQKELYLQYQEGMYEAEVTA